MTAKPMNVVASINILDRGDGPAQEVLSRTARNRAQRQQDETRNELTKITDRVDKTLGQFDLVAQTEEEGKSKPDSKVAYVSDLDELYAILSNPIAKRKYLQHASEIIIGFQDKCIRRFKLMQQVNEFFSDTTHRLEEEDLNPPSPEVDLDEVQQSVTESLDTAKTLTARIAELNKEMVDYMYQYANAKAGNKNRKKLEKALSQAKDDVQIMSEKLLSISKELEEKDDKIQGLYRQVEFKTTEAQRFKTAAEIAKKAVQESAAKGDESEQKDKEIRDLQKKVEKMTLELMQKEESRESSQRELLSTGRENVLKIRELEEKLASIEAKHQSELRDTNDFSEKQLIKLSNANREELQRVKAEYEKEIAELKLTNDKQSTDIQGISSKCAELDQLRLAACDELNIAKASLEAQILKEADFIIEKESLLQKLADLVPATPSVRSVSATSSQASEALKSEVEKPKASGQKALAAPGKGKTKVANKPLRAKMSSTDTDSSTESDDSEPDSSIDIPFASKECQTEVAGDIFHLSFVDSSEEDTAVKLCVKVQLCCLPVAASSAFLSFTDVKGRGGVKKKGKNTESVIGDETPASVHYEPEPAEVQLPEDFDKEDRWASYPMNQAQSAFSQYREFTQQRVHELNMKVLSFEKDADRKVKTLKTQFSEHKNKWYSERSLLIRQIELSQKQTMDAEKDADGALSQLEEFVSEAEQLVRS
ncbi:myosin-3-like [Watersipora subatra]|uniref:myosin-3-like n=1 Tax=Watersipora subatra TaxID=2589382 RepID=UPI00355B62C5